MGYNFPIVNLDSWYDDESGYIGSHCLAKKYDPPQKCERCGKPAAWNAGGDVPHSYLCLQCADEWHEFTPTIAEFHEGRMTSTKWFAGFNEFMATKPKKINLKEHNRQIMAEHEYIKASLRVFRPDLYKQWYPE